MNLNEFRNIDMEENVLKFSMYQRDSLKVFAKNKKSTVRDKLITITKQRDEVLHSMNGKIGTLACVAIEHASRHI